MGDFQHFVPRFYLKGFLDPASLGKNKLEPYLWVVDIEKKTVKSRAPKNIAGFSRYYDVSTEPFNNDQKMIDNLLTVFETRVVPIIRNIRNNQFQTTIEERYDLATFIGVQIGRVPIFRQHISDNFDNVPNAWLQDFMRDEKKLKQKLGKNAEKFKELVRSGKIKLRPKFKSEEHEKDFMLSVSINLGIDFAKLVFGMRWVFLLTTTDTKFIASDNPVALLSPGAKPLKIKFGELNEEIEIYLPISSECAMLMHSHDVVQKPNIGSNEIVQVGNDTVEKTNWGILPTIDKYAYCSSEEQAKWVLNHVDTAS